MIPGESGNYYPPLFSMIINKIALFYGHVASNYGDLAINKGSATLLLNTFPDASLHVVFLDSQENIFLESARSSIESYGNVKFSFFNSDAEKSLYYNFHPSQFLTDCGVADADLIVLAASEHFFHYSGGDNAKSIFWYSLPALAAKSSKKICVILPSTFGPFEEKGAYEKIESILNLVDDFAVRESLSAEYLNTYRQTQKPRAYLDPAFFIKSDKYIKQQTESDSVNECKVLGLIMRSEGLGIRLNKDRSIKIMEGIKRSNYRTSKAFQFSLEICRNFLSKENSIANIFVQTVNDQALAGYLKGLLDKEGFGGKIKIIRPLSVDDYLSCLSNVDYVVASRFHAIILALVVKKPVFGAYFDVHGHKIPGLFKLLGMNKLYVNLSVTDPEIAAKVTLESFKEAQKILPKVLIKIDSLKERTVSWLNKVKVTRLDEKAFLNAFSVLGSMSLLLAKNSYDAVNRTEQNKFKKTEKDLIKKYEKEILLKQKKQDAREKEWIQINENNNSLLQKFQINLRKQRDNIDILLSKFDTLQSNLNKKNTELINLLNKKNTELINLLNKKNTELINLLNKKNTELEKLKKRLNKNNSDLEFFKRCLYIAESKRQLIESSLRKSLYWRFSTIITNIFSGNKREKEIKRHHLLIKNSGLFNKEWYFSKYKDVKNEGIDPIQHYLRFGYTELRNPSPAFDTKFYLQSYPDVEISEMNPLVHYIIYGMKEGRLPIKPTNSLPDKENIRGNNGKNSYSAAGIPEQDATINYLLELYDESGSEAVLRWLSKPELNILQKTQALYLLKLGKVVGKRGNKDEEVTLARMALQIDRTETTLRNVFWRLQQNRNFKEACDIGVELEKLIGEKPTKKQEEFLARLRDSQTYLLSTIDLIVDKRQPSFELIKNRLCYVLHNSLPYTSGGYGTRSHGVAIGLKEAGYDVIALTRPGFPLDIKPELTELDVINLDVMDDIKYMRILKPRRAGMTARNYIIESADALEDKIRELRPEIIVAASNYLTGLPALIAARRLGVPFVYEVRGLWEVTRMSRESSFQEKPAFAVQRLLESAVCKAADHVFTLTQPMLEELVSRGVDEKKIDLLPNSCDPQRFVPQRKNMKLAEYLAIPEGIPIIGYVGTFVVYEGLEDLAKACGLLKRDGIEFRLLLVGNENASGQERGPISEEILGIADTEGFRDWLIMPGRIPHEEVESYYSLIDICPFPRIPWPVCEMVSPLKPLEALAMEKAVVVSSVRALKEIILDKVTGLVFEKGNIASLVSVLKLLIDDPELRSNLGRNGRKWVVEERTWSQISALASDKLEKIIIQHKSW